MRCCELTLEVRINLRVVIDLRVRGGVGYHPGAQKRQEGSWYELHIVAGEATGHSALRRLSVPDHFRCRTGVYRRFSITHQDVSRLPPSKNRSFLKNIERTPNTPEKMEISCKLLYGS